MRGDCGREPVRGRDVAALLGEEFLELVDDEHDPLAVGSCPQQTGHGLGDSVCGGPGQTCALDLGTEVLTWPHPYGQPPVAAAQSTRGQGGQDPGLDQRGFARAGRAEQQDHALLLAQMLENLFHGVLPALEPLGLVRGERLQPPVRAYILNGQGRPDPP